MAIQINDYGKTGQKTSIERPMSAWKPSSDGHAVEEASDEQPDSQVSLAWKISSLCTIISCLLLATSFTLPFAFPEDRLPGPDGRLLLWNAKALDWTVWTTVTSGSASIAFLGSLALHHGASFRLLPLLFVGLGIAWANTVAMWAFHRETHDCDQRPYSTRVGTIRSAALGFARNGLTNLNDIETHLLLLEQQGILRSSWISLASRPFGEEGISIGEPPQQTPAGSYQRLGREGLSVLNDGYVVYFESGRALLIHHIPSRRTLLDASKPCDSPEERKLLFNELGLER